MKSKLLLVAVLITAIGFSAMAQPDIAHLKHQWSFEDGTMDDEVGEAHGFPVGDVYVDGGKVVNVGDDDFTVAARSYIELPPEQINVNTYSALSIEAWYTCTNAAATWQMVVYLGDSTGGLGAKGVFISPARGDDMLRGAISTEDEAAPYSFENGVNYDPEIIDEQVHCILSISDSVYMFVNGVKAGSATLTASIADIGTQLALIGRGGYWGDANFSGTIDKVSIWDAAMTEAEAAALFAYGPDPYVGVETVKNSFNPTVAVSEGAIAISNLNNATVNSVKIYNMLGAVVYETADFTGVINHNLNSSVYIISVESNQGIYKTKVSVK